jgi:predicted transcriptional regulator of viral defense system
VVPAVDFIDAMMAVMRRRYYVALLSAAELYGASHQRPQVFQVMVDRPVADRDLGRVRLRFYTHSRITAVPTLSRNTATGQVRVSTPAASCLDLATRPNDAGGMNNVATVIAELVEESALTAQAIVEAAGAYPTASLRRLGWLLDHVEAGLDTGVLQAALTPDEPGQRAVTLLDPAGPRRGHGDRRWGVVENVDVEPDL